MPMWKAKDRNARSAARTHELAPGKFYSLSAQEFTPIPAEHAAVLLRDPAFEVIDENGAPVSTLPDGAVSGGGKTPMKLPPGQVLANLDELKDSALLGRAKLLPDGEKLTNRTKRDTLIRMLLEHQGPERGAKPEGEADADDLEEVDPKSLDKLFEGT